MHERRASRRLLLQQRQNPHSSQMSPRRVRRSMVLSRGVWSIAIGVRPGSIYQTAKSSAWLATESRLSSTERPLMYLSDCDLRWAINKQTLIVKPPDGIEPAKIDPTSIDLRLDNVNEAKIWNMDLYKQRQDMTGVVEAELRLQENSSSVCFQGIVLIRPPVYDRNKLLEAGVMPEGRRSVGPARRLPAHSKPKKRLERRSSIPSTSASSTERAPAAGQAFSSISPPPQFTPAGRATRGA